MEARIALAATGKLATESVANGLTTDEALQLIVYLNLRRSTRGLFRRDH